MMPPYASATSDANFACDSLGATCNGGGGGNSGINGGSNSRGNGSLRYRAHPLANGVCGNGRGALAWTEAMHNAAGYDTAPRCEGGFAHRTSTSTPPPGGRLLTSAGTPPIAASPNTVGANFELFQQTPLTFEQVGGYGCRQNTQMSIFQINGHQPAPIYMRALSRRRRLFAVEPESIDKVSIVCFPLAFTLVLLAYSSLCTLMLLFQIL